jgi:hypothetical protein
VSGARTNCPACGGPVEFKLGSSVVVICPYCRSAVARGDRNLEDLGKVAALADTGSLLDLGMQGRYDGVKFELTGRAQLAHEAGGVWDEWYAHFADGRWGWLAEAQGRYYLTFEREWAGDTLQSFDGLNVGSTTVVPNAGEMTVAEKGTATAVSAAGEIPYRLTPGAENQYADLSGPDGKFATIDYGSDPPTVYAGKQVTLDDLGVPKTAKMREQEARRVAGVQVNCPQCGGPMALRAPDKTERVTCPNCAALLDCEQGNLKFLKALQPGKVVPLIPVGTVGKFADGEWMVIGFMQRSVKFDRRYYWVEYLLYEPRQGFRWLVCSDNHWSMVRAVPPGEVTVGARLAHYQGRSFQKFQKASARVEYVAGEFYWKVSVGETVEATDYVRPPEMLSREVGGQGRSKEINWSLGTYTTPGEIQAAFKLQQPLPAPEGIAPNQPFPYTPVYRYFAWLFAAAVLLGLLFAVRGSNKMVFSASYPLRQLDPAKGEKTQVFFSDHFELRGGRNVEVHVDVPVSNGWVYVDGDLVEDATGYSHPFGIPVTHFTGVEDGEQWSEGGTTGNAFLSAPPPGKYSLRLEVERDSSTRFESGTLSVRVVQGVPRVTHWLLCVGLLSAGALAVGVYHLIFVSRRWKDSEFNPFHSS